MLVHTERYERPLSGNSEASALCRRYGVNHDADETRDKGVRHERRQGGAKKRGNIAYVIMGVIGEITSEKVLSNTGIMGS